MMSNAQLCVFFSYTDIGERHEINFRSYTCCIGEASLPDTGCLILKKMCPAAIFSFDDDGQGFLWAHNHHHST